MRPLLLPGAALALFASCGAAPDTPAYAVIAEADLDEAQRARYELAVEARGQLAARLVGELTEALSSDGPAEAIRVCSERAPLIAAEVSAATGVEVGRTSWKLRNGANRPPDWAEEALGARPETPVLLEGEDGSLGALLPIRLGGVCVTCHGPAEGLAEEVRVRLAELYPDDQATGFAEGDLRGWFWMRVPPRP
jgi:hypothetical protein